MTELMLAHKQTEHFHTTEFRDDDARALADKWCDELCLLPVAVSHDLNIPATAAQVDQFAFPLDESPSPGDPLWYIDAAYNRLSTETGLGFVHAKERAGQLFDMVFAQDVDRMRQWWTEGYFPRVAPVVIRDKHYELYNHLPAFRFTGNLEIQKRLDPRTRLLRPYLAAEIDMSPQVDDAGEFVPVDVALPVEALPSMTHETRVSTTLAVRHLQALRSSVAPWVIEEYGKGMQDLPSLEEAAAARPARRTPLGRLATLLSL